VLTKRGVVMDRDGHHVKVENGSQANAILKLRNAYTGTLVESFYVVRNGVAQVTNVPDDTYRIQFAFGDDLAADCVSFRRIQSASQFDDIDTFATRYEYNSVVHQELNITLYAIRNGNAHAGAIDIASFDKE
jgi:hypothetical protein